MFYYTPILFVEDPSLIAMTLRNEQLDVQKYNLLRVSLSLTKEFFLIYWVGGINEWLSYKTY